MNRSLLLKRVFALSGARRAPADRKATWSIPHRRWAWLALGVSCTAYVVSLAHPQAFHPWGHLNFFDLTVYRGAARLVLEGRPVYGSPIWHWAPFTYPPFAAIAGVAETRRAVAALPYHAAGVTTWLRHTAIASHAKGTR